MQWGWLPRKFNLRRQMAAAAGKKSTTSLSLFMKAFGLEVEAELFTRVTQTWAAGVWVGKWCTGQKEAWMRQIQEVQIWRQVRGPAGPVMCETRYLGTKWPHWHTLTSSDEKRIDMIFVCPRDENMLVHMARSVYWRQQSTSMKWFEPKSIVMWPERSLWKEVGRKRDCSILAGRILVCVKLADWRKAQKSTGFTTAQNGTRSGGRFRRPSESGSKRRERGRKSGSGKEASSRTLSVKANGIEASSA